MCTSDALTLRKNSILLSENSSCLPLISIVDMDLKIMSDCITGCVLQAIDPQLDSGDFLAVCSDRWCCDSLGQTLCSLTGGLNRHVSVESGAERVQASR